MSFLPRYASLAPLALLVFSLDSAAQEADPDAPASARTLDTVRVDGHRPGDYLAGPSAAATGLALELRDTPQSLTVITRQRMRDQGMQSVRDVLDNVTGVSSNAYDSERVVFYARGFQIDNMAYDGVPIAASLNSGSADGSLDTVIYDRIEVVRGATGLLSGAGSPAASINFVRKHADSRQFTGEASLSAGSWDDHRATFDLGGALNRDGSVRGRLVGAYQRGDSYLDRYHSRKKVAYGVIDADLDPDTTLSVGVDYQQTDPHGVTWGSYPVFYDDGGFIRWRRGFTTSTDWSYWANRTRTVFADFSHAFGEGWKLRALASRREVDGDMALFYVYGFPNRDSGEGLEPFAYRGVDHARQGLVDLQLSGPFRAFGREHELIAGLSSSRYHTTSDEYGYDELPAVGNFLQWNGHYPYPDFADSAERVIDSRVEQQGLYAAARISLAAPLKLIVGARYSRWKNDTDDVTNGDYRHSHRRSLPYAGLVYEIAPDWSAFASYTGIFEPQNERMANGVFLDPMQGSSREVGIKGSHFEGRLSTSLVLFDTRQDNVAEADGDTTLADGRTQAYYAVDGTRSRGAELEIAGRLGEDWNASLGWSHFDLKGPDGENLRTALPRTLLRLFTTYRLPGAWHDLTVGGGVNWQSASHAPVDGPAGSQRVNQASVTLLGAMARYVLGPHAELQFNADNLLDRKYFVLDEYSNLYYAAPMSWTLDWRYRW